MPYYTFINHDTGEEYGSFEVFYAEPPYESHCEFYAGEGYYWATGFPGCLWDSEPIGPFQSASEAIANARNA